jgi:hypothetical protein
MNALIALMIGFLLAVAVPAAVHDSPDTFNGMLRGSLVHVPLADTSLHLAWPIWIGASLLIWILFKVARG